MSQSILLSGRAQDAWTKLLNWQEWPRWDGGMEHITFDAPVRLNSIGKLKLKGGPEVKLFVTELTEGKSYTSEFDLLGTRFRFIHYLESLNDKVKASVDVDSSGLTDFIFGNMLKAKLLTELPKWLDTFKRQFESEYPVP